MRRVFAKEWKQGQMIALFGLLMGGLVVALWGIFTVAYVRNWIDQENVNGFCGVMFYLVPLVLAIFVGAGLFAAEVERGTMPLLLALPFSRRQVWVGKTLAGLALMLSAVAMAIVPGAIATRPALEEVGFWQFLPELALASALLYFGALFWSTVLASIVSAFLTAIATAIGLVLVGVALMVFGGRLFGPPLLDIEVWALAAIPGLIAGSYLGFVRGEAFLGRRRWRMPLIVALAIYLVTMVALGGFARSLTRYDRSHVYKIGAATVTGKGAVVSALTYASPVHLTREAEVKLANRPTAGDRRVYSVVLDLDTGKELLVRRETGVAKVSPDGEHAVLLTEPRPLTWRGQSWGPSDGPIVEIWDLSRKRMTYRGVPIGPNAGRYARIQSIKWSPDGKWIGLVTPGWESGRARILIVGLDGSLRREVTVTALAGWRGYGDWGTAWDYAPTGAVVYALGNDGAVTRHDLATGRSDEVWTMKAAGLDPEDWAVQDGSLALSPDGKSAAVALIAYERPKHRARAVPAAGGRDTSVRSLIAVLQPDSGEASVVLSSEKVTRAQHTLVWSGDSGTLYSVFTSGDDWQNARDQVAVWRVGQAEASVITLPMRGTGMAEAAVLPAGRLIVQRGAQYWVIGSDAHARRVVGGIEQALTGATIAGVDMQGRLLVTKWEGEERWVEGVPGVRPSSHLAAVDVDTGKLTKVYP
jgi:WD40 repeat protein